MPLEFQTALISAVVALFTAALGGLLTWNQIQRERIRWVIDIKTSYAVELYKTRLASYSQVYATLSKTSTRASEELTPGKAQQVAREINEWFYSTGGMCAEASTRGALLGLREALFSWAQQETMPQDFYAWRNIALQLLRRDLDIQGLESFDPKDRGSLLEKLQAEVASLGRKGRKRN